MASRVSIDSLITAGIYIAPPLADGLRQEDVLRSSVTTAHRLITSRKRSVPLRASSAEPFLQDDGLIFDLHIPANVAATSNIYRHGRLQRASTAPEGTERTPGGRGRGRRGPRAILSPARTRTGQANQRHHQEASLANLTSLRSTVQDKPSPFIAGHDGKTKILDVGFGQLGSLGGCTNSIEFIPSGMADMVRKVYIKFMQSLVEDFYSVERWRKFLLLSFVLFTPAPKGPQRQTKVSHRQIMRDRCGLLLADDWSQFTLGSFQARHKFFRSEEEEGYQRSGEEGANTQREEQEGANAQLLEGEEGANARLLEGEEGANARLLEGERISTHVQKRVEKYVQHGNLSTAMRFLVNSDQPRAAPTQQVFHQLQQKHPSAQQGIMPQRPHPSPEVQLHVFERSQLVRVLSTCKKLVKHGLDHLRYEHLLALIRDSKHADDDHATALFGELLAEILSKVANAQIPAAVLPAFRDNELFAAAKKNGDVRPIGIAGVLRKLATILAMQSVKEVIETRFKDLQFGMDKNGAEKIINTFRAAREFNPTRDTFAMDGINAFNTANRCIGLAEIKKYCPNMLPLAYAMYGSEGNMWYFGMNDAVRAVSSQSGYQQGDPMASFLYSLGAQPFVDRIKDSLGDSGIVQFFIDDGNLHADFNAMVEAIGVVLRDGEQFGYKLKMDSGSYNLAQCGSDEALRRKNILVELGLSPSIILIHPDDLDDYHSATESKADPGIEVEDHRRAYGCTILGSFVGTDEYISDKIGTKLNSLRKIRDKLLAFPNLQIRYQLLKWCFRPKIHYWLRTMKLDLLQEFISSFEGFKREIMQSITTSSAASNLTDQAWEQCQLRIKQGGFGLDNLQEIQHAAQVSSLIQSRGVMERAIPGLLSAFQVDEGTTSPFSIVRDFHTSGQLIFESMPVNAMAEGDNIWDFQPKAGTTVQETFTSWLMEARYQRFIAQQGSNNYTTWLTSIRDDFAGKWLEALPKYEKFTFSDSQFQTATCYRLFLSQPSVQPGTRCDCQGHPYLDGKGHHLMTACSRGGARMQTHDNIGREVNSFLRYNGIRTRMEEEGCFAAAEPDTRKRPDISILPGFISDQKTLLDIAITCPVSTQPAAAKAKGTAASRTYKAKVSKYGALALSNQLDFQPIIFESTGMIHPASLSFLVKCVGYAAKMRKFSSGALLQYFMTSLSATLQKHLANALLENSMRVYGNNSHTAGVTDHYHSERVENYSIVHA
jgi:hypothetical protein